MQRFVLQQNIERFRARLAGAPDEGDRKWLRRMLATAERELALLNAGQTGVRPRVGPGAVLPSDPESRQALLEAFRRDYGGSPKPAALIDPEPGLLIVEANPTYEQAVNLRRERMAGQPLFLLFPDNPDDPEAHGVSHLYDSLRAVAETGRPHAMADQRYDIRDGDGRFVERYWRLLNSPMTDAFGRLVFLLHVAEEVTEDVLKARPPG